jgi:hypothetical protein
MEENPLSTDKGLMPKIYKELEKLDRTNNPIHKWTNELNSSQKQYKWLICEEMFNILNYKGNANQNYTKIPSHPSQTGIIKKTISASKNLGRKEPSYAIGGIVN